MARALGIEQGCNECRMCGNGKGGKKMYNGWYYCDSCFYNGKCEKQKNTFVLAACKDGTPHEKFTNADKIRNMTNEELAESRIDRIDIYCKSDTQMWTGDFSGIAESKGEALKLEKKWLESECDAEC